MKVTKADVRPIVMATFPDYKGRMFTVEPVHSVRLWNLNWSGGTKYTYKAVSMADGNVASLMPIAPWEEYREGLEVDLPTNVVIVKHTYFCGKDLGITVYCHPQLVSHLLKGGNGGS